MSSIPQSIILNIGIQLTEATAGIATCTVRLYRNLLQDMDSEEMQTLEDDEREYTEEALEATEQPLQPEQWTSAAGVSTDCLCVSLEIDPAWEGPVRLEVETSAGTFEATAILHKGLNSFFFSAARLMPLPSQGGNWKKILGVTLLVIAAVAAVGLAVWSIASVFRNDEDTAVVADTVADTAIVVDSTPAIAPETTHVEENNTPTSPAAYNAVSYDYSDYSAGSDYDETLAAEEEQRPDRGPGGEKYYGIDP